MRSILFAALLLGACIGGCAEEDVDEKDVVVLTEKNFDETLGATKFALVEFYAPWCGHCKSLKPEWAKAATALKEYSSDVIVAKLDATEEKTVAEKHEVKGFPTLKWFVDGKVAMEYSGGRTAPDIIRWVKKRMGPATTEIGSVQELEAAQKDNKIFVLGFFDKLEGDEHAAFESAAEKNDDGGFLKTTSADVAAKLGLTAAPGFAVGRTYDDFGFESVLGAGHAAFEGKSLVEALEDFIKAEKLPAFIEFTQDTSQAIFGSGIAHQVIVIAPGKSFARGSDLFNALVETSSKLKGKIIIVTVKIEGENGKPIIDYFGLEKESKDTQVVGFNSGDGKKFKFEGPVTTETLVKFSEDVIANKAAKFFKSAPEPAEPLDNGVTVITANTVATIVKDPTKDVLLEVYAPWCGHCKALAPVWEKLAKRFAKIDSVVIAKMDGTQNEHPEIEAQGFPTLLFFPAEEGAEAVPYEGGRSLGDLTKFLKKHAKVPFELPKKKKTKDEKKDAEPAKEEEEDKKDEL